MIASIWIFTGSWIEKDLGQRIILLVVSRYIPRSSTSDGGLIIGERCSETGSQDLGDWSWRIRM